MALRNSNLIGLLFSFLILFGSISAKLSHDLIPGEQILPSIEAELPGFKTAVTQNGLNYFETVGIEILEKILATLVIPDLSGDAGTPIGHVDWWLTQIKLHSFAIPAHIIKIDAGLGVTLAFANVEAAITLDWKYRKVSWPHISDHGSADIGFTGAGTFVTLAVTTVNSRPHVDVRSDAFNIGNLHIKLHGGASWLYDFFINILKKYIEEAINKAVTEAITKNVDNGVNKALSTLPIEVPINHEVEIDFPLVDNPYFGSTYLTISQLGEFYEIAHHTECPSPRYPLPNQVTGQMVNMMVGEYVANSAGFVFYNLGKLKITIHPEDIPSWSPFKLNTASFQTILPQLYNKYPNLPMQLNVYCTQTPIAAFSSSGATVSATGNIDFMVIEANGTVVDAFTLNGTISTHGQALLEHTTLYGNLTYLKADFSLYSSNIGPFNVAVFDNIINMFFSQGLIPAINNVLKQGFPLPTIKGLTFVNPSIGWGSGYLYVATDVTYTPPESS